MEVTECADEEFHIIALAGHEMSSAEVNPLELREPGRELIYNMYERARESVGAALTMTMDMKTFDGFGEFAGRREVLGQDAEAGTWGAGIVEFCLYLAVFGVNAQAEGRSSPTPRPPCEGWGYKAMKLREAVEGDVRGAAKDLREIMLGVGGAVGVGRAAEFLESQACFIGRRGCGVTDVFAEDWESLPKGKSLEGQDDLGTTAVCDILDQGKVAT